MQFGDAGQRTDIFGILPKKTVQGLDIARESGDIACILFLRFSELLESLAVFPIVIQMNLGEHIQTSCDCF